MDIVYDRVIIYFRILNKLTPENFDKLSYSLVNIGIDNKTILKGIIILVSIFRADLFLHLWNLPTGDNRAKIKSPLFTIEISSAEIW